MANLFFKRNHCTSALVIIKLVMGTIPLYTKEHKELTTVLSLRLFMVQY